MGFQSKSERESGLKNHQLPSPISQADTLVRVSETLTIFYQLRLIAQRILALERS